MHALFRRIELVRVHLRPEDHTQAMLNVTADFLSAQYVTCEQFYELLCLFSSPLGRTSVFVTAFGRIVDGAISLNSCSATRSQR